MDDISRNVMKAYNKSATIYNDFVESKISHNSLAETPFVHKLMGNVEGLKILDLCCGAGRYSVWMAQNGAKVTGIDYSEKLIQIGKDKIKDKNLNINFIVSNINEVDFLREKEFDGIIGGSVQLYSLISVHF